MFASIRKIVVALAVVFSASSASAFFVEPFAGVAAPKDSLDGSVAVAGARAAMGIMPLFSLGAQVNYFPKDGDYNGGPMIHFGGPMVNLWLGYSLVGSSDGFDYQGGPFVGAGLTSLPFLTINLEYHRDEFKLSSNNNVDVTTESIYLTLGLPLP